MKKSILLVLLCFTAWNAFCQDSIIDEYIQRYQSLAITEMVRTGVPAAISLAQGIEESQAGTGWLTKHANNQFGIKCKSDWQGETINYDDDRNNECFRKYLNDSASWRDHSNFLKNTPRYAFLFYLDPMDYKAWAYGLKEAGYATNKKYARKLIHLIQTYDLQQYSEQAMAMVKDTTPKSEFAVLLDKKIKEDQKEKGIIESAHESDPVQKEVAVNQQYPSGLFHINNREVLYLPQGTQLISIAAMYHIRLSRLLRYNELNDDVLDKDMLIYLQKKRKTGAHDIHVVAAQESLHDIAQEEGIRLKWLYKRNRLAHEDDPDPGTALVLKGYAPSPESDHAIAMNEPEQATQTPSSEGFWNWLKRIFSGHNKPVADQQPTEMGRQTSPERQLPDKNTRPDAASANNQIAHRVQTGETLYSISHQYGTTVAQLREANHLTGNTILVGQKLIIPKD